MDNVGYDGGPFGLFLICVFLFGMIIRHSNEFNISKVKVTVEEKPRSKPEPTTTRVIEDAVMFLCGLGENKRKVEPIVKDLSAKKKYEKVQDLVKDFYKYS